MNLSTLGGRRRIEIICLGIVAWAFSLSGCAFSRAVQDTFPAWMRSSRPQSAEVRTVPVQSSAPAIPNAGAAQDVIVGDGARDSHRSYASTPPPGEKCSTSSVQSPVPQPAPPPDRPIAAADTPVSTWSRLPPPSYPPVRMVSDGSTLLAAPPLPARSPDPQLEPVQVTLRPEGMPAAAGVVHADEATFEQEVLRSDVPVLVDFYASWCGPCKRLAPVLEEVAVESRQAKVVKVNVDDNPKLAARYGVKSLPSLMVFKDGRVVAKQQGYVAKSRLKTMLAL